MNFKGFYYIAGILVALTGRVCAQAGNMNSVPGLNENQAQAYVQNLWGSVFNNKYGDLNVITVTQILEIYSPDGRLEHIVRLRRDLMTKYIEYNLYNAGVNEAAIEPGALASPIRPSESLQFANDQLYTFNPISNSWNQVPLDNNFILKLEPFIGDTFLPESVLYNNLKSFCSKGIKAASDAGDSRSLSSLIDLQTSMDPARHSDGVLDINLGYNRYKYVIQKNLLVSQFEIWMNGKLWRRCKNYFGFSGNFAFSDKPLGPAGEGYHSLQEVYSATFSSNQPVYGMVLHRMKDKVLVTGLLKGSSAANSGLGIGDEVVSIDEKDALSLSPLDIQNVLRSSQSTVLTILGKDGQIRKLHIIKAHIPKTN